MSGPISIERRLAALEKLGEAREQSIHRSGPADARDVARAIVGLIRECDPNSAELEPEAVMNMQAIAELLLDAGLSSDVMPYELRDYFRRILSLEVVPVSNVIELNPDGHRMPKPVS